MYIMLNCILTDKVIFFDCLHSKASLDNLLTFRINNIYTYGAFSLRPENFLKPLHNQSGNLLWMFQV